MKTPRIVIAIHLVTLAACGSESPSDADSGVAPPMDAAPGGADAMTASMDTMTRPDSGVSAIDAGVEMDAAPQVDFPEVVSTSPMSGELGVAADAVITVTFSKPMDADSVEGAVTSNTIDTFTLSWDAAFTTLTITPTVELEYAFGDNTRTYDMTIGVGAMDAEGNALQAPFELTFNTLRRVQSTLSAVLAETFNFNSVSGRGANLYVGDGANNGREKGFVTFDLTTLPEGITSILEARFSTSQESVGGQPFTDLSPEVRLDQTEWVNEGEDNIIMTGNNISTSTDLGVKATDVTAPVVSLFDANAQRARFSMKFLAVTDNDDSYDRVLFARNETRLVITYLVP